MSSNSPKKALFSIAIHLESYLFDDEVRQSFVFFFGKPEFTAVMLLQDKRDAMAESIARGNPPDDLKSASGPIDEAKLRLAITGIGNDARAFAQNVSRSLH